MLLLTVCFPTYFASSIPAIRTNNRADSSSAPSVEKQWDVPGLTRLPTAAAALPAEAQTHVYVDCTLGKDSNDGTSPRVPFKSLAKARDAIRAARAARQQELVEMPASVTITGVCRSYDHQQQQDAPLSLDERDSHTVWRGAGGTVGGVVVSGGIPIDETELHNVSPAEAKWFKPSVVGQIRRVSLSSVNDTGSLRALTYTGGNACIRSDFFEPVGVELLSVPKPAAGNKTTAQNMMFARYPNLRERPVPENWADYFAVDSQRESISVKATASQVSSWVRQANNARGAEIWSHGLWKQDWADSHRRVITIASNSSDSSIARITLQRREDFADHDCNLTAASHGQQGGHLYLYNMFYELDQPGEYVVDHHAKTAFVFPHTHTRLEATVASSLLSIDSATNVSFDGLSFRGARGAGVVIRRSVNISVSNGAITDCGMSAFNVTGGERCGLLNVDVVRCGTGGAVLEGGDRSTLTEAHHFVKNSRLRDSNRWVCSSCLPVLGCRET